VEKENVIVNKFALKILVQIARKADLTLNEMDILEDFEKIVEKKSSCAVCRKAITSENWPRIVAEFKELFRQVDSFGVESLTEANQVLYENRVHIDCYDQLT
jgi:hypothetical protein